MCCVLSARRASTALGPLRGPVLRCALSLIHRQSFGSPVLWRLSSHSAGVAIFCVCACKCGSGRGEGRGLRLSANLLAPGTRLAPGVHTPYPCASPHKPGSGPQGGSGSLHGSPLGPTMSWSPLGPHRAPHGRLRASLRPALLRGPINGCAAIPIQTLGAVATCWVSDGSKLGLGGLS